MFDLDPRVKIYLATGHTDMRKGMNGLTLAASEIISSAALKSAVFVFRGKSADRIKILWYDGQGFCLYYKCLDRGKFTWPKSEEQKTLGITRAQLAMLLEGIDWRTPMWSNAPIYAG